MFKINFPILHAMMIQSLFLTILIWYAKWMKWEEKFLSYCFLCYSLQPNIAFDDEHLNLCEFCIENVICYLPFLSVADEK